MDELMSRVQQRFTFGSMDSGNFRFCETKPAHVDRERMRQPTDHASSQEQSQMRAVLGSIGWVARPGRPELSYVCFALQGKQSSPTVVGLKATNKLLSAAQKTSKNGIRFVKGKFNFEEAVLLSVTDASHAAELIECKSDELANKDLLVTIRGCVPAVKAELHVVRFGGETDIVPRAAQAQRLPNWNFLIRVKIPLPRSKYQLRIKPDPMQECVTIAKLQDSSGDVHLDVSVKHGKCVRRLRERADMPGFFEGFLSFGQATNPVDLKAPKRWSVRRMRSQLSGSSCAAQA
eukprot:g7125.t1